MIRGTKLVRLDGAVILSPVSPACVCVCAGEKLVSLQSRLWKAMTMRRQEERARKAALHRLDNEDCGEEEEEEEEELTESEGEEVRE